MIIDNDKGIDVTEDANQRRTISSYDIVHASNYNRDNTSLIER